MVQMPNVQSHYTCANYRELGTSYVQSYVFCLFLGLSHDTSTLPHVPPGSAVLHRQAARPPGSLTHLGTAEEEQGGFKGKACN